VGYRTTRRADQDIIDVYAHGAAEFGIDHAERYHRGLVTTFALLADNPRMARERAEFHPPVRLHPYQAHVIVYVERGDGILIVRVLHGRQDWERHL
jgi:toxin ParE1/3/4